MSQARAAAVLLEQIRGIGHAFHPARDDIIHRSAGQRLGAHDDRLHAAAADLVDRGRLHRLGQARLDRCLAGRGLAKAGGQHTAHIGAVETVHGHTRTLDRGLHCRGPEIGGRDVGKRALHAAHRRAGVRQDDDGIGCAELGHACVCPSVLEYRLPMATYYVVHNLVLRCSNIKRREQWRTTGKPKWKPYCASSAPRTTRCAPNRWRCARTASSAR